VKLHSPAAVRNVAFIADVLADILPESGTVLEIASGSGQHVVDFASRFPELVWQPSEAVEERVQSIGAYLEEAALENVRSPLFVDICSDELAVASADAMVNINMIHASPWQTCIGLMKVAGQLLPAVGVLYMYGPFFEEAVSTAPSNVAFDRDLRSRDPRWGIRQLSAVAAEAAKNGLALRRRVEMPANNLSLIFGRG
jgi:hypothetical protein